jgi:SAM-dependent methyltransferase
VGSDFSGKILDLGCRVGLLSIQLSRCLPSAMIHGHDVSAESIRRIPSELTRRGHFSDRLDNLDYNYRLAIASNVMHHIPKNQREQTIAEIAAHLAEGGRLILFEHDPWSPINRWVVHRCAFDENIALLRPKGVCGNLSRAKLRLHKREYIAFSPRTLSPTRPLEVLVSRLLP